MERYTPLKTVARKRIPLYCPRYYAYDGPVLLLNKLGNDGSTTSKNLSEVIHTRRNAVHLHA